MIIIMENCVAKYLFINLQPVKGMDWLERMVFLADDMLIVGFRGVSLAELGKKTTFKEVNTLVLTDRADCP